MPEYKLSYTANEINERLGKINNAVLYTEHALTDEQKVQSRANINAANIFRPTFTLEQFGGKKK